MFTKINLKNYRCFQDAEVSLSPFTVLVGPNGSGKTAFLEALQFLSRTVDCTLSDPKCWLGHEPERLPTFWVPSVAGFDLTCHFTARLPRPADFLYSLSFVPSPRRPGGLQIQCETLCLDTQKLAWRPEPRKLILESREDRPIGSGDIEGRTFFHRAQEDRWIPDGVDFDFEQEIYGAADFLRGVTQFGFRPEAIAAWVVPAKLSIEQLASDGSNLTAILDYLHDTDRSVFEAIEASLRDILDDFKGFGFDRKDELKKDEYGETFPVSRKRLFYLFVRDGIEARLSADVVSSGLLLYTAFLSVLHASPRPSVILIEEPERGVHPSRLRDIVGWLRKIAAPPDGREPTQVILTTHSPYLLDWCKPEEVLVLHREKGGPTRVVPMAEVPNVEVLLAEFQVGELWTSVTEEKLVGSGGE